MRLRIGVVGKVLGFLPVCWTFIAENVDGKGLVAAKWLSDYFHGLAVKEKYLTGSIFVTLTPKED